MKVQVPVTPFADTDPMGNDKWRIADALIEKWHMTLEEDEPLWEYMRLTHAEYRTFVEQSLLPADFVTRHSERVS